MKAHFFRVSMQVALLTAILSNSCSIRAQNEASATPEPAVSISNTAPPPPLPITTFGPLPTPAGTPYPVARTIRGDVVAFIIENKYPRATFSLWVANLDGTGEKRLVTDIDNSQACRCRFDTYLSLQWSPDAKWISYVANDTLWLISPDGSIVREFLSLPDKSKGILFEWAWSPDSSRIVYVQTPGLDANPRHAWMGIVDVPSGQLHELPDHTFGLSVGVSWTPDGQSLWLTGTDSFSLIDAESGNVHGMLSWKNYSSCMPGYFVSQTWSPNGQWTTLTEHGTGTGGTWFCTRGINGEYLETQQMVTYGPFWDHTGNILYFGSVISLGNSIHAPTDQVIMRFDVRTDKAERLWTLDRSPNEYLGKGCVWSLSMSPDTHSLEMHCESPRRSSLTILNLKTYSTVTYGLDTKLADSFDLLSPPIGWSSDSQNLVLVRETVPFPSAFPDDTGWPYLIFYSLNTATGKTTAVSGWHDKITEWSVSPAPVSP